MTKFEYKLTSSRGMVYHTTAENHTKAMTSFQRKRTKHIDSYSSIARGVLELIGESKESLASKSPLIEILKNETESLRLQFLEKTDEYARREYARALEILNTPLPESPERDYRGRFLDPVLGAEYKRLRSRRSDAYVILQTPLESYVQKAKDSAEGHYQNSIVKLAMRIEEKGLDVNNIKATTSHIGVNINTIITDGVKSVRAWTIIAEGPIVRPHYRYLIK